jgi:hypothetical protein
MSFRNSNTASGTTVITAGSSAVNYVALQVITSSDLTYVDGNTATTTLTAVPAGTRIDCIVTKVTTCSGVVLGYTA